MNDWKEKTHDFFLAEGIKTIVLEQNFYISWNAKESKFFFEKFCYDVRKLPNVEWAV